MVMTWQIPSRYQVAAGLMILEASYFGFFLLCVETGLSGIADGYGLSEGR